LIDKYLGEEHRVFLTQEKADELLKYYNVPTVPSLVAVKKDDMVKNKKIQLVIHAL